MAIPALKAGAMIFRIRLAFLILSTAATTLVSLCRSATAQGVVVDLGTLGGSESYRPRISDDGRVVVGTSTLQDDSGHAFRWSAATGMVDIGTLDGFSSEASGANRDGSVIAGTSSRAFRWTQNAGFEDLGSLSSLFAQSYATDINSDGNVVVGGTYVGTNFDQRAFRWTPSQGMANLGTLFGVGSTSFASGVSADGSVIVGRCSSSQNGFFFASAFRWSALTGMQAIASTFDLPVVSSDGLVLAGGNSGTWYRITDDGFSSLPPPQPYVNRGDVKACNGDGSLLVGESSYSQGSAIIWNRAFGTVTLSSYLTSLGVDLTGWDLQTATDVSADGRTICGFGLHNGARRVFLVTGLPFPRQPLELVSALSPVGNGSRAYGLSASGTVAVGNCYLANGSYHAARWTEAGARDLGTLGGTFSEAYAASGDGLAAAGYSQLPSGAGRAFYWTAGNGMQDLGTLGGTESSGQAISTDGLTVAGVSFTTNNAGRRAFRWRQGAGMESLGTLGRDSLARGISSDGAVVVGESALPSGELRAFRWTTITGMQNLGALGGPESRAYAVSGDGTTVGGNVYVQGQEHAFRWTQSTGMQDLGTLGGNRTKIYGLSDDGAVAVGSGENSDLNDRAFLWTAALGMTDLNAYLPTVGIDTAGWVLTEARAVSADGSCISGIGRLNGVLTAFVARGVPRDCRGFTITSTPADIVTCIGTSVTLSAAATAATPIEYQWFHDGSPIEGATSAAYSTPPLTSRSSGGVFSCRLSTGCASRTVSASVLVRGTILYQPSTQEFSFGLPPGPVYFAVTMAEPGAYQYQWQVESQVLGTWISLTDGRAFDGMDYSGTRTNRLVASRGVAWRQRNFRCVVTTTCGEVASDPAALRFPYLIVTSGSSSGSGRVEGYVDFQNSGRSDYIYQNSDSDIIPFDAGINFVRSGGGQTGGGFIAGAYSPTINFGFSTSLVNEPDSATLSLSTYFSISGNCGMVFSGVTEQGEPYVGRWSLCAPNVQGQVFYQNTLTGETGVLSLFGAGERSITVAGPPPLCRADFNNDGDLNPDDLADFIGAFFSQPASPGSDFNADGSTDPDDLADFIGAFFSGC